MMDMFQDIVVCSNFIFSSNGKLQNNDDLTNSMMHLNGTHRRIIDSIHQTEISSQVTYYKVILEERSNALLMSEETMNFYNQNLQIIPETGIKYAMAYLMKMLSILLKYNQMYFKEMQKLIKKTALRYCKPSDLEQLDGKELAKIAEEFQKSATVEEVDPVKFQDGVDEVALNKSIDSQDQEEEK